MSEPDLTPIISEKATYNIIRILRDGPLKEETVSKYLATTSKLNKKSITKTLKALEKSKFIKMFQIKNETYYLLIKDFYLIRIPPKQVLDFVQNTV